MKKELDPLVVSALETFYETQNNIMQSLNKLGKHLNTTFTETRRWIPAQDKIVMLPKLKDKDIAEQLGRSVIAVRQRRNYLKYYAPNHKFIAKKYLKSDN